MENSDRPLDARVVDKLGALASAAMALVTPHPRLLMLLGTLAADPTIVGDAHAKPTEVQESQRVEDIMGSTVERLPVTHQEMVRETSRIAYQTAMDCFLEIHAEILAAQEKGVVIPGADLGTDPLFKELLLIGSQYVHNGGDAADVGRALARYQAQIDATYKDMLAERNKIRRETAGSNVTGGSDAINYRVAGQQADVIEERMAALADIDTDGFQLPAPAEEAATMGQAEREVRTYLFAASHSEVKAAKMLERLDEMEATFKATLQGNDYLSAADKLDLGQAIVIILEVQSFLLQERVESASGGATVLAVPDTDADEAEGVDMAARGVIESGRTENPIEENAQMDFMKLGWDHHGDSWFLKAFLERFGASQLTMFDREVRAAAKVGPRGAYAEEARASYHQDTRAAWFHALSLVAESMGGLPDHVSGTQAGFNAVIPMDKYLSDLLSTGVDLHSDEVVKGILTAAPLQVSEPPDALQRGLRRRDRKAALGDVNQGRPCYMQGGALSGNSLNTVCAATDQTVRSLYPSTIVDPRLHDPVVGVGGSGLEFVPDVTSFVDLKRLEDVLVTVSRQAAAEAVMEEMGGE